MDLRMFGGKPVLPLGVPTLVGADPDKVEWNFGVHDAPPELDRMFASKDGLHDRFPALAGKWDGQTTINHWNAVLKNYSGDWSKAEELIQYQPRGTCGGRAGSFTGDMIQHIMIAAGKRAKFHRVSHAAVYFMARKKYGMLNGDWRDDNNDGVASGSVPEALKEMGVVQREEDGDANWYGDGSDDLACQLGAGLRQDLAAKILKAGSDNLVTEWVPVRSAQELADGIASGGVGVGSDSQGFTMSRDQDGFCRPTGTWQHYQVRCSVGVFNGRKGFGYNQSWGKTTPSGPRLDGHPGNCFGVDFDVQDRIIKSGRWAVVFGFPLWDLESGNVDVTWYV